MNRERAAHARFACARMFRSFAAAVTAVSVLGLAVPAAAAAAGAAKNNACYSRAEHAAEQTVRMHTELMVIGLTCQGIAPTADPFGKYQDFTIKHRAFLSAQESVLMGHFRKVGGGNATRQFDSFRTDLANESSRRAAIVGNYVYCWNYVDRIKAVLQLNQAQLKTLTTDEKDAGLMHLSSKPLCDVKVVSNPDPAYSVAAAEPPRSPKPPAKTDAAKAKPEKAKTVAAKPPAKPAGKAAPEKASAKPAAKPATKPTSDKVAANFPR